ncbi:MAG: Hcp family type VI secretion system effector [Vicinamibacterales bacterium]
MPSDTFLKLGDIKGESIDSKHKGEIEISSWSWGVSNAGSIGMGSGGGTGKASFHDLSFAHTVDKASPTLLLACSKGTHFPEATLTARKSGGGQQEFIIMKLTEVLVTSVQLGGGDGSAQESVTLQFGKVELEYSPQKPDGSLDAAVSYKYNIAENVAF